MIFFHYVFLCIRNLQFVYILLYQNIFLVNYIGLSIILRTIQILIIGEINCGNEEENGSTLLMREIVAQHNSKLWNVHMYERRQIVQLSTRCYIEI